MADMSPEEARALVLRLATLEDEITTEGIITSLRENPEWLQLPLAKRQAALDRYKVLRAYDRKKTPTKADATRAAGQLGVQLRSFYFLLRNWRDKKKSVLALVPYRSDDGTPRPSRLGSPVADHLRGRVTELLQENPAIALSAAVRAI